jgi:hypothetical protein
MGEYALHNTAGRTTASYLAHYFRCAIKLAELVWVAWTPQQRHLYGAEADLG